METSGCPTWHYTWQCLYWPLSMCQSLCLYQKVQNLPEISSYVAELSTKLDNDTGLRIEYKLQVWWCSLNLLATILLLPPILIYSKFKPIEVQLRIKIIQYSTIPRTVKDSHTLQPNVCAVTGPHPPFEQNCTLAMCLEWMVRFLMMSVSNEPL